MAKFYQKSYSQKGLTTDLPDERSLQDLMQSQFRGSSKDLGRTLEFLRDIEIDEASRVLDFGSSWGYATWQFSQAGYRVEGYEISEPRAEFGRKNLGVAIHTELSTVGTDYDVVYSGHVLEHVPNPEETLEVMLNLLRPGGLLIAFTPNGSAERQASQPQAFHRHWGQVHPVLLTDKFVQRKSSQFERLITSSRDTFTAEDLVYDWKNLNQQLEFGELLILGRKSMGVAR